MQLLQNRYRASAADGEELEVTLSGISDEVKQVELCVINKLRRKIVSFYQLDCSTISDTIKMEVEAISRNVSCIQQEVLIIPVLPVMGEVLRQEPDFI